MGNPTCMQRAFAAKPSTPRTPKLPIFVKQTLAPVPKVANQLRPKPTRTPPPPNGRLPGSSKQLSQKHLQFGSDPHASQGQCRYRRRTLVLSAREQKTFLSVDHQTGEEVFLREIHKRKVDGLCSDGTTRLAHEADTLKVLQGCPSVLEYKDQFQLSDKLVVITEACYGGTLQQVVESQGRLSELAAMYIAEDILQVLSACKREGIFHGHVHPRNFWIKSQADFGSVVAGTNQELGKSLLRSNRVGNCNMRDLSEYAHSAGMGVLYWAPEVFAKSPQSNSDLWSLGVLLYQVVAGRNPFWSQEEEKWIEQLPKGEDGLLYSLLRDLLWRKVDFSFEGISGVSEECESFLRGLLSTNHVERLSMEDALQHPWLASEKVPAKEKRRKSVAKSVDDPANLGGTCKIKLLGQSETKPRRVPLQGTQNNHPIERKSEVNGGQTAATKALG